MPPKGGLSIPDHDTSTRREQLNGFIRTFKTAYENKDLLTLRRISEMSRRRAEMLQMLFDNYSTIRVSIDVSSVSEDTVSGEILITQLVDTRGKRVRPSPILRSTKVTILRDGVEWGRVIWDPPPPEAMRDFDASIDNARAPRRVF